MTEPSELTALTQVNWDTRQPVPLEGSPRFHTTRWTLVCAAQGIDSPDRARALEDLCRMYWYPLYAYVRRRGYSAEDAQDLTQDFFLRLLKKAYLQKAAPQRGRFRTFLLVALKRFVTDDWRRNQTQKRGGGQQVLSMDAAWAEGTYLHEPADHLTPEKLYERRWAIRILEQAIAAVGAEMELAGKQSLFEALQHTLTGASEADTYADIADRHHLSEAAVKGIVFRMRKRFRLYLRSTIADTVSTPAEIDDELEHLISTLSG